MDICTLIIPTVALTIACTPPMVCHEADGKKWCSEDWANYDCPSKLKSFWECKRDDGSSYVLKEIPK